MGVLEVQQGDNIKLVFALIILWPSENLFAQEKKDPHYLMAAMGDSMTAAFLANTELSWFNQDQQSQMKSQSLKPQFSFGGTIARVFESRGTLSWATGKNINSHFVLLKRALQKQDDRAKVSSFNIAVSGGEAPDLLEQADAIVDRMKDGHYTSLKYVTLLIGNNDACVGNSETLIKTSLHETFRRLSTIKQSEPIRILMSGIPKIPEVGIDSISRSETLFGMSCEDLKQDITKTCLALTSWKTNDQFLTKMQVVQKMNETLMEAADDANRSFQNLDVRFSNRLFDQDISAGDLALDCFHPNGKSQARIAEALWAEQPWFH